MKNGMNKLLIILLALTLGSCSFSLSTIKDLMPRDHDSYMVGIWVETKIALDDVNCDDAVDSASGWMNVASWAQQLSLYTSFRSDPQHNNIQGLHKHANKMAEGSSVAFCKLGKKTAEGRLQAARNAWEDR